MKRTLLFLSLILGITFNLFAAGTYIIDVAVSSASTKSKAQSQLTDKGYHVVDKDVNAGASGNFVYIGYKTNEDDPDGDPVCDLFVLDADKAKAYYEGSYTIDYINDDGNKIMYSQVVSFGNKNLNDGCSGADALVLYFARSGAPAITDIGLSKNKKSGDNIYIAQMMDFDDNLDFIWDGDADLNKTAGGEDLWLWFERPEGEIIQEHTWVNGFCECGAYQEPSIKNNTEYQITNAGNLYWYVQNITDETMTAVLTTNITVNSNVLTSSDTLNTSKASSFREWILSEKELTIEGNNHTISGLYFKDASVNGVGLLVNGTVKNLGVVDSYFEGRDYVGAICGTGSETIENCYSKAVVKGEKYVGGICGEGADDQRLGVTLSGEAHRLLAGGKGVRLRDREQAVSSHDKFRVRLNRRVARGRVRPHLLGRGRHAKAVIIGVIVDVEDKATGLSGRRAEDVRRDGVDALEGHRHLGSLRRPHSGVEPATVRNQHCRHPVLEIAPFDVCRIFRPDIDLSVGVHAHRRKKRRKGNPISHRQPPVCVILSHNICDLAR